MTTQFTDEEAHDALVKLALAHTSSNNKLVDSLELPKVPDAPAARPPPRLGDLGEAPPPPQNTPSFDAATNDGVASQPDEWKGYPKAEPTPLGFQPKAPRKPAPVDTELRAAQDEADKRKSLAGVGQAVTDFTERPTNFLDYAMRLGGGGVSAPPAKSKMWKDYEEEGTQALEDLKARRAGDASLRAEQQKADANDEDDNPESGKSQLLRATLSKYSPDIATSLVGKSFREMSPIAGPELAKMIEAQAASEREKNKAPPLPKPGDPLAQAKLDEEIRHHKADESRPHGKPAAAKPAAPAAPAGGGQLKLEDIADPGERAMVQGIVEGRAAAPAPGSKYGQHILALAMRVDPKLDTTKFQTYQHARSQQSTSQQVTSAKAVRHHMDLLKTAVDSLPEGMVDTPLANRVAQGMAGATGSDKYTEMQTEAKIVGAELGKALGEGDAAGREMVQHLVDPSQTKAQWAKSIPALEKLRDEMLGVYEETISDLGPTKSGEPAKPAAGGWRSRAKAVP